MLRPMLDALPRPLAFVLRHLLIGVPLAAFIALFLSIAFNDSFVRNFVYSLCIGLACQFIIDLGRRGAARSCPGWTRWPSVGCSTSLSRAGRRGSVGGCWFGSRLGPRIVR